MYALSTTKQFEKDYKRCWKRGLKRELIDIVLEILEQSGTLPHKYKTHPLKGEYAGFLE